MISWSSQSKAKHPIHPQSNWTGIFIFQTISYSSKTTFSPEYFKIKYIFPLHKGSCLGYSLCSHFTAMVEALCNVNLLAAGTKSLPMTDQKVWVSIHYMEFFKKPLIFFSEENHTVLSLVLVAVEKIGKAWTFT